jgi:histone deacetylase 1/2
MMARRKKVGYVYSNEIGKYDYGKEHPMKTMRVPMVHDLLFHYGTLDHMNCYVIFFCFLCVLGYFFVIFCYY